MKRRDDRRLTTKTLELADKTKKLYRQGREDAKEEKRPTAEDAKDAKEQLSKTDEGREDNGKWGSK